MLLSKKADIKEMLIVDIPTVCVAFFKYKQKSFFALHTINLIYCHHQDFMYLKFLREHHYYVISWYKLLFILQCQLTNQE